MPIGFAIFLTLLAATLARVGTVLLKQATVSVDKQAEGMRRLFRDLTRSKRAILGVTLQVVGIVLYASAVGSPHAPISVLQPLRASGIVIMAFLAVIFLNERLNGFEWFGVALMLGGAVLLSASVGEAARPLEVIHVPRLLAFLMVLALLAAIVGGLLAAREGQYFHWPRSEPATGVTGHMAASNEVPFGMLAGLLLGIGYLHAKVFFLGWQEGRLIPFLIGASAMLFGLLGGLAVLLASFRKGRVLIVTTVNLLVNQLVVIIGGYSCLDEQFPQQSFFFYARLLGLGATLAGIVMLARFVGGRRTVATIGGGLLNAVAASPR